MNWSSPCLMLSTFVSKYFIRHLCNIGSLPVQSPITNIVSSSSDTGFISSHQTLSFPLQADMNSPDSTGISSMIVCQPTNKTRQIRKDRAFHTDHYQTLDGWDDNAIGRHFEKIVLVKHPHLDTSYYVFWDRLFYLLLSTLLSAERLGLAFC